VTVAESRPPDGFDALPVGGRYTLPGFVADTSKDPDDEVN
jgi:hypothetical protein